jgi:phage-related protein
MSYGNVFSIRPGEVGDATSQLAELADRVQRVMDAEALNLTVQASARDEVSQRVAATLNEVHTSFGKASDQGQQQLRELTTTIRTHAGNFAAADEAMAV